VQGRERKSEYRNPNLAARTKLLAKRWQAKNEPAWIFARHFSAISVGKNCSHFAHHFGKTKRIPKERLRRRLALF
jgi:hypothetical protein